MGIIVPNGNIAFFPQRIQNLKAVRLLNIFQIDCADARLQHLHKVDNFIGAMFTGGEVVFFFLIRFDVGIDADRISVYTT